MGSVRIGVTASRKWKDPVPMAYALGWLAGSAFSAGMITDPGEITVITGRALGGDRMFEAIARRFGCTIEPHEVTDEQWRASRAAGFDRNQRMVDSGAWCWLAFILDGSSGATDCKERAERAQIPVIPYEVSTRPAEPPLPPLPAWLPDWELGYGIAEAGLEQQFGRPFEAQWDGTCACGGRWQPGDMLVYDAGEDRFVHADHAE